MEVNVRLTLTSNFILVSEVDDMNVIKLRKPEFLFFFHDLFTTRTNFKPNKFKTKPFE